MHAARRLVFYLAALILSESFDDTTDVPVSKVKNKISNDVVRGLK